MQNRIKELPTVLDANKSSLRTAAIWLFFALNLVVYLIRLRSVWLYGALFSATAVESPMIDSVWRCMHHGTIYTSPFTYPFSLSLYNYLFYHSYAFVLRIAGVWDAGILTWGRQFTLLFAIMGSVAQWRLVRSELNLRGITSALSLCMAVGLWLCTSLVKYWALSIRPDMAAAALVMIALWIVARQPRYTFAYAGIFLYLAWAFKQSVVLTLIGLSLWLLCNKQWKSLSLLVGVFALLVSVTLYFGTPEYRFSILVAPQMVKGFSFGFPWILHALGGGITALFLNLYWVAAPAVLLRRSNGWRRMQHTQQMLFTVFSVALIVGILGMGKIGGTSNYLFEAFAAGSTVLQLILFSFPERLVTYLVLFGCVQPALQIAGVVVGYHVSGKKDMIPIATAEEYNQATQLRDRLATMSKPIFTTDGVFALPWYSTVHDSPSVVIDPNFQQVARTQELNGGIEGMLLRGEFPTVLIAPNDLVYKNSLNAGYSKTGETVQQGVVYSIYELRIASGAEGIK